MKRFLSLITLSVLTWTSVFAQFTEDKPKLVVGIIVDQMKYDYISRYWDNFGDGGFKKLVNEGYFARNGQYNYAPTVTGPGHASVYSGTSPAYHSIVNNHYYDRELGKNIYCVDDDRYETVGAEGKNGKKSPYRLTVTNLSDELKWASNLRSKVYTVSIKDRSAVLPAGHKADGAYWLDDKTGNWITSSFYMDELPNWITEMNSSKKRPIDTYMKGVWDLSLPVEKYSASMEDNNPYESLLPGKKTPTFPYELKKMLAADRVRVKSGRKYDLLKSTPFGNTVVTEMAMQIIDNEKMGDDNFTDLLGVSYSSTDYAGHAFGPQSMEVEDVYIKLDKEIEHLINHLDQKVGKGQYVIFLTADHAGAQNTNYMREEFNFVAENVSSKDDSKVINDFLVEKYGEGKYVVSYYSGMTYLNRPLIKEKGLDLEEVQKYAAEAIMTMPQYAAAVMGKDLERQEYTLGYKGLIYNGFNPRFSPDVYGVLRSHFMDYQKTGTSHFSPYKYDTHVPIMFYGWKIEPGYTHAPHTVTEIAPTICSFLNMNYPSGCYSDPILIPLKK
ncbi:alkaline phosphatase family protein [Flammeovirga yaeyamensis]|uniref:Alkaline phosphatase family protein n=1 Tax=Flammeovirga yaeyamensis TaxID=367791 RepID=A0AAX1MYE1_9BACT|nr:alkaline phosphatase PafA [Flammeovirga yaeyamensis]MBB3696235.1 putative AlkP superfamily pyrophosphatase or phosphodiesterase [Flammeovirga yaeyamensis]NMF34916.1 alkaline phosphatase family protein [Flammeovirga yaeyamensis]QWG00259.1 alkaline phosphatase family protein [Flammeovirga yaeyamensis]